MIKSLPSAFARAIERQFMRILGVIVTCIAVLLGSTIIAWKVNFPTYTYRYRMTVEVLADGVVHSGASVIEVRIHKQPQFGNAPPQVSKVRGEAVFVDLGNGRNVIALLAAGPEAKNVDYPYNVVPAAFELTFNDEDLKKLSSLRGIRRLGWLPTLATFTDLNDPATLRVVTPEEFEQLFGAGIQLRGVSVEMTTEPITWGFAERIPWLGKPIPWLIPNSGGTSYTDSRPGNVFRWHLGLLKRDY